MKHALTGLLIAGSAVFIQTATAAPTKNPWGGSGDRYSYEICETSRVGAPCSEVVRYVSLEDARDSVGSTCRGPQSAPWQQKTAPAVVEIRHADGGVIESIDCKAVRN